MGRLKNGRKGMGDKAHREKNALKATNKLLSKARRSQASPDGAGAGAGAGNVQDENAPPASQRRRVGVPFLFGWFGAVVCAVKRPRSQFPFPALCSRRRRPAHRGSWGGSGRPRPDGRAGLHVNVSSPGCAERGTYLHSTRGRSLPNPPTLRLSFPDGKCCWLWQHCRRDGVAGGVYGAATWFVRGCGRCSSAQLNQQPTLPLPPVDINAGAGAGAGQLAVEGAGTGAAGPLVLAGGGPLAVLGPSREPDRRRPRNEPPLPGATFSLQPCQPYGTCVVYCGFLLNPCLI